MSSPLLTAPIVPALARLSAPGILLVAFQTLVSVGDTYFVGRLGTAPLAGLALVFPLIMLLQMTSAGAMGGGVSSAIARALGARDAPRARRLVVHALVIAAAMAAAFTLLVLAFQEPLYALLGGRGDTLQNALHYSSVVFAGAITVWIANTLSSILRGTGNMGVPAAALICAALLHLPLSAVLTARIGIAGAGIAYVAAFGLAALAMACVVFRRASALRPRAADLRLEPRLFGEILRVGGLSALSAFQTVLTAVILTGFVGRHGAAALAGYGVGLRLELLQIPLVFAVGQALVVLVGTHVDRRGLCRRHLPRHRRQRGARAAGVDGPFQRRRGGARKRLALPAQRGAVLPAARRRHRALLRLAGRRARALAGARRHRAPCPGAGGLFAVSLGAIFAVIAGAMAAFGLLTMWFVARADWR